MCHLHCCCLGAKKSLENLTDNKNLDDKRDENIPFLDEKLGMRAQNCYTCAIFRDIYHAYVPQRSHLTTDDTPSTPCNSMTTSVSFIHSKGQFIR